MKSMWCSRLAVRGFTDWTIRQQVYGGRRPQPEHTTKTSRPRNEVAARWSRPLRSARRPLAVQLCQFAFVCAYGCGRCWWQCFRSETTTTTTLKGKRGVNAWKYPFLSKKIRKSKCWSGAFIWIAFYLWYFCSSVSGCAMHVLPDFTTMLLIIVTLVEINIQVILLLPLRYPALRLRTFTFVKQLQPPIART